MICSKIWNMNSAKKEIIEKKGEGGVYDIE